MISDATRIGKNILRFCMCLGQAPCDCLPFLFRQTGRPDGKHLEKPVLAANGEHQVTDSQVARGIADDGGVDTMARFNLPDNGTFAVDYQALSAFANNPFIIDVLYFLGGGSVPHLHRTDLLLLEENTQLVVRNSVMLRFPRLSVEFDNIERSQTQQVLLRIVGQCGQDISTTWATIRIGQIEFCGDDGRLHA